MRFLVIAFTLGALLMPAAAQQNYLATGKKPAAHEHAEPAVHCAAAHSHHYSDMRIALVEITETEDCGFSYANLEDRTVGLDNHFQYADSFIVARNPEFTPDAQQVHSNLLTRQAIRKGMRGIAVYCNECMTILMFKWDGK